MIIYRKYIQEKIDENTSEKMTKTTLEAKFRFMKESAPMIRQKIGYRMYSGILSDYLNKYEGISYNSSENACTDDGPKGRKLISIKKRPWKLGIDIKISSFLDIGPKEMLDLEALNTFIFTGECPKIPQK